MNTISLRIVLPLLTFILLPLGSFAQQPRQVGGKAVKAGMWEGREIEYVAGEISVKLEPHASEVTASALFERYNVTVIDPVDELGWGTLQLPQGKSALSVAKALKNSPLVLEAGPVGIIRNTIDPNDPYFQGTSSASYAHQWALKNTGQSPPGGTNDDDIDAELAWDHTTGSSNSVVAVLDSGIPKQNGSLSHPDLDDPNKMILGPDYVGDGNGVKDEFGHGTHVAGIAAAESDNGTGISGVCWSCKVMVVQVTDDYGSGGWPDFYNGVKYAVDYAVNNNVELVINASLGGPADVNGRAEDAVTYAENHGVAIVASAGNEDGGDVLYPAAYSTNHSNVIAVSSTDHNDDFSSFSSSGPEVVVAAPGGYGFYEDGFTVRWNGPQNEGTNIYSTTPNYSFTLQYDPYSPGDAYTSDITQDYGYLNGTSMSAPHVAGTAALMLSLEPFLSPSELRDDLEDTAQDVNGGGFDNQLGHGRINAYSAVDEAATPAAPTNLVMTNAGQVGAHPNLDWDDNTDPDLDHYNVYRCTSHYTSCSWSKIATTTTSDYTDTFVIIKEKEDANDEYSYYVSAVDATDFESDPSNTVSTWGTQPLLRGPDQENENPTPDVFALHAPAPNPVASQTTVQVDVPETKTVTVTVYDVMGRQVARLADRTMTPGFHPLSVHPDGWPSGVYFVRMSAGSFTATERLTVVR